MLSGSSVPDCRGISMRNRATTRSGTEFKMPAMMLDGGVRQHRRRPCLCARSPSRARRAAPRSGGNPARDPAPPDNHPRRSWRDPGLHRAEARSRALVGIGGVVDEVVQGIAERCVGDDDRRPSAASASMASLPRAQTLPAPPTSVTPGLHLDRPAALRPLLAGLARGPLRMSRQWSTCSRISCTSSRSPEASSGRLAGSSARMRSVPSGVPRRWAAPAGRVCPVRPRRCRAHAPRCSPRGSLSRRASSLSRTINQTTVAAETAKLIHMPGQVPVHRLIGVGQANRLVNRHSTECSGRPHGAASAQACAAGRIEAPTANHRQQQRDRRVGQRHR